jgi:hypothetical protein
MDSVRAIKALQKIGYTLLHIQSTERVIKLVMQTAMPCEKDLFTSLTERLLSKEMERPLGAFLTELRKRASLHADFDALLRRFLVNRNTFIHDISEPEGWSLKSDVGLRVIDRQLAELLADSDQVRSHFKALLYSWKIQGEMDTTEDENEAFHAISGKYEGGVLSRKWGIDA